jgi:hypothetical protein
VVTWFGLVAIGTLIFGHGFVWPCIFGAIAYCVIDALFGRAKGSLKGRTQAPKNATTRDKDENQLDAR